MHGHCYAAHHLAVQGEEDVADWPLCEVHSQLDMSLNNLLSRARPKDLYLI